MLRRLIARYRFERATAAYHAYNGRKDAFWSQEVSFALFERRRRLEAEYAAAIR